ncbi:hypothetical protein [Curtobacterium sp. VKM Ac-2884]|uniref:hypothetical protein n=1 Tax=Curtobacterium sp. VKM Ac-2884 TaxID=2783818 RepID=UPI00188BCFAC|nr:hypothetical protein [Curtobacterium sp. VKM Ac-2884]MBF4603132.1 hypothetical protein [Curtobacterium sp. VKM Ac-2884]
MAAVWASISLRSSTDQRLRARVDMAFVALEERAREAFEKLRDDIDRLYPTSGPFDPATAFQDPAELGQAAKKGVATLRMRSGIQARFRRMLAVCSWIRNGAFAVATLVGAATALYFLAFDIKPLWGIAAGMAVVAFGASLVGIFLFAWLESAIQRAVEASNAGGAP